MGTNRQIISTRALARRLRCALSADFWPPNGLCRSRRLSNSLGKSCSWFVEHRLHGDGEDHVHSNSPTRYHATIFCCESFLVSEEIASSHYLFIVRHLIAELVVTRVDLALRVNCDSRGEEILNQREIVLDGKALCRGCAGGGYVRCLDDCAKA